MLAEVFVRAVSNFIPAVPASIPVAWEWSSYLMAATFTFGAAMTLRAGGHIRVSLLLANAPPALRRLLDIASAAVALVFMAFLAYAMVKFTYASYAKGQTSISSETPVWIPQAVVTFGMVLLALQFLARVIQAAARPAARGCAHEGRGTGGVIRQGRGMGAEVLGATPFDRDAKC